MRRQIATVLVLSVTAICELAIHATARANEANYNASRLEVTTLETGLIQPMELAVTSDGRILYIEIQGQLKVFDPQNAPVESHRRSRSHDRPRERTDRLGP